MRWRSRLLLGATVIVGALAQALFAQEQGGAPAGGGAGPGAGAAPAAGGAPAGGGAGAAGGGGGAGSMFNNMLFPILLCIAVFWFLVILPERRKQKARQLLIGNLKKGDQVVTSSGIVARVAKDVKGEDRDVLLQIDRDQDVRVRFLKSAIQEVIPDVSAVEEKGGASSSKELAS